jgi:hypothetical protein
VERDVTILGERGIRSLAVAKQESGGEWRMLGETHFMTERYRLYEYKKKVIQFFSSTGFCLASLISGRNI